MKVIEFLTKIWRDSVWSQVISTILAPYVLILLSALKSVFTEDKYIDQLLAILQFNLPLWVVILLVWSVFWLIYGIMKIRRKADIKKQEEIVYYKSPYITFKNLGTSQRYCANCWQNEHKRIQLNADIYDCFECPICHTSGNFSELEEKHHSTPFESIYKF